MQEDQPVDFNQAVQRVRADVVKYCAARMVTHEGAESLQARAWDNVRDFAINVLFERSILAVGKEERTDTVEYPAGAWQAFRQRWFPRRWLARWPVRMWRHTLRVQYYAAVCPHHGPPPMHAKPHLEWLAFVDRNRPQPFASGGTELV